MPALEGAPLTGFDGEVEASESSALVVAGHDVGDAGGEFRGWGLVPDGGVGSTVVVVHVPDLQCVRRSASEVHVRA